MELRAQRQQAEAELKLARVTYSRQQRLAQTQAVSQAGSRHRRDGDGCETGANWHH
ncbi:macA domain protein [Escherichia coli DEC14B]|nr:macA domain protein [Escherichia coli DEC14B]